MAELIREGVRVQKPCIAAVPNKPQHYKKNIKCKWSEKNVHVRENLNIEVPISHKDRRGTNRNRRMATTVVSEWRIILITLLE
jgi:hypothetical protein